jgi:hypothetical protein
MDPKILFVLQEREHGIRDLPESHLKGRPVLDEPEPKYPIRFAVSFRAGGMV